MGCYNENIIPPLTESNHHFDSDVIDRINELFDLLVSRAGDVIRNRFEHNPAGFNGKVLVILNSGSRSAMSIPAANHFLNDLR